jgi:hypothetical protein
MAAVVVRMLKEEIPQPTGWHPDEARLQTSGCRACSIVASHRDSQLKVIGQQVLGLNSVCFLPVGP